MSLLKKRLADMLSSAAYLIEVLISAILMLAVLILLVEQVINSGIFWLDEQHIEFNSFLSGMFNLVIGIAFTKMLCKHTPDTVVEVLMFSVSRQFIVSNSSVWDRFLSVVTLAGLFAIRKFLISKEKKKCDIESQVQELVS